MSTVQQRSGDILRGGDRVKHLAGISLRLTEDDASPETVFSAVDVENIVKCEPQLEREVIQRIVDHPLSFNPPPRRKILTITSGQTSGKLAQPRRSD